MAVDHAVTRAVLTEELELMNAIAGSYGWDVQPDLEALRMVARMRAHNGDLYIVEAQLDNYKEWPPFFEFIDPDSGQRGTPRAYPQSNGDNFFHTSGPCICAPFNRKAYKFVVNTGPHADWQFSDWMTSKANGFDWSRVTTLGDMLGMIQTRLMIPTLYKGRMG